MLLRKFAAIKLWPGQKAAEDEVIERLKIASKLIDLECLVVDSSARLIHPPHTQLTQDDVDFVLSLHFETPKRFDIFSFVTLWNPLQFYTYRERGYRKFTRHLLTHDDFLSCGSASGDDHVMRTISNGLARERPLFCFYPTLSGPILEPTLGDRKIFYVGINWEKLWKEPGRHDGFLKLLDESGDLRLYGPKLHGGVEVWQGYKSYVDAIPFDGVSVVRLIHQAGISLALSSDAHAQSEMMSSRIFESAAAGAVIICNENQFVRRHFGDSVLYIDTTLPPKETYGQVKSHLAWIESEPGKALEMAKRSQNIFCENFRLDTCLERIYAGLPARKAQLSCAHLPHRSEEKVCVVFLMPEFQPEVLEQHIASFRAQRNVAIRGILAMDAKDAEVFERRVTCRLATSQTPFQIVPVLFMERRLDGSVRRRRPIGEVVSELIRKVEGENYVCFVDPGERLFSEHLCSLLRVLQDSPAIDCAWSDMIQERFCQGEDQIDLCDDPDVADSADNRLIGFGRFVFRMSALEDRVHATLPYLDALPMHLLYGISKSAPTRRCTLFTRGANETDQPDRIVPLALEREMLIDLAPEVFVTKVLRQPHEADQIQRIQEIQEIQTGQIREIHENQQILQSQPPRFSLADFSAEERTQLAVELAHSLPMPSILKKIAFGTYRLWFRIAGSRERNGDNAG